MSSPDLPPFSLAVTGDKGITLVSLSGHLHYLCLTVIDQVHKKAGEMQETIKIIVKKRTHYRTLYDREAVLKQTSIWPSCKTYLRDS